MPSRRPALAYRVFNIIQLFYVVTANLLLQLEEEERQDTLNTNAIDDDDLEVVLQASSMPISRPWAFVRSHEWKQKVLAGTVLQERGEFETYFRMSRDSFNALHEILGFIPFLPALM